MKTMVDNKELNEIKNKVNNAMIISDGNKLYPYFVNFLIFTHASLKYSANNFIIYSYTSPNQASSYEDDGDSIRAILEGCMNPTCFLWFNSDESQFSLVDFDGENFTDVYGEYSLENLDFDSIQIISLTSNNYWSV